MTTAFRDSVLKYYKQRRALGYSPKAALGVAKHDARYGFTQDLDTKIETQIQRRKHRLLPSYGSETYDLPGGMYAVIEVERDDYQEPPWEESDGHGVVSDWEHREERDRRWVLCQDRWDYRYYDWRETLEIAKRDRWGPGPDKMAAVRRDFEYLSGWCNDRWYYVTLTVTLFDEHGCEITEESCGGMESFCEDYLCSEARSWLASMLRRHLRECREAERAMKIESRFRDAMECGI